MLNNPAHPSTTVGNAQHERQIGFVLALVGLVTIVVGCFLPYVDVASTGFAQVQGNTAFQSRYGWTNLVFSALAAVAITRAYLRRTHTWAPLVLGVLTVVSALNDVLSDAALTLCPVDEGVSSSDCTVAEPGLGVYVIGGGGAALLIGGFLLARRQTPAWLADIPEDRSAGTSP